MIIHNFKINASIYRDLSNEAIRHRITLSQEIEDRLERTLDNNYKYGTNKILTEVALKTLEDDGYNKFYEFDYKVAKCRENTINKLKQFITDDTDLSKEICIRLAYTLHDPFYE